MSTGTKVRWRFLVFRFLEKIYIAPYVDYLASPCRDGAVFGWVTFSGD